MWFSNGCAGAMLKDNDSEMQDLKTGSSEGSASARCGPVREIPCLTRMMINFRDSDRLQMFRDLISESSLQQQAQHIMAG
jgi:hypothetical protein